jgi:hypothetical protein
VKGEREKLGSDGEELSDEPCFRNNIALCYPSDSALADHAHRFDSFESSPSTSKGAVAFCQPGPLFDGSMILFNNIVEILAPYGLQNYIAGILASLEWICH